MTTTYLFIDSTQQVTHDVQCNTLQLLIDSPTLLHTLPPTMGRGTLLSSFTEACRADVGGGSRRRDGS